MNNTTPKISYNTHALGVLEFDRIRDIVASHAESAEGRTALTEAPPASDAGIARALLAETGECMRALRFDDAPPSTALKDTRELFHYLRVGGHNIGIEGIRAIGDNLGIARRIADYYAKRHETYPLHHDIAAPIVPHHNIEKEIDRVITPELEVSDDASPELRSIRRQLDRARGSLRSMIDRTLLNLADDVVSERLVTIRNGRYVIPIRDSMKNKVPGAIHDRSQTGKTLFVEPIASIEANNRVIELESAERDEIERILRDLTARLAAIVGDLECAQDIIVRLDTIKARARYGTRVEGVVPDIGDEPYIHLRQGRHPLLDWKFRARGNGTTVVPLELELGGDTVTMVVTGPNAGGKTVALKTIGMLALMAMSGMPVPAAEGTVLYAPAGVFADIGDEQSIENDLSTFSSHMQQIVTILHEAQPGSLVLLDELGSGTNPSDGEAIALAVLQKLTGQWTLTVATTHHGGLKVYAHDTPGVINASMQFDNERLLPTFMLRSGVPGSSYAFEIAGRMGMPRDVLSHAEALVGGERKSLEGLITEMEERLRVAEEEHRTAEAERKRLERARIDLEGKLEKFREKRDEMMRDALEESERIVADSNRRIESAIKSLRERDASREAIREARTELRETASAIDAKAKKVRKKRNASDRVPVDTLEPGMTVWSASLKGDAVVEDVLDGGKKARIHTGKGRVALVVGRDDLFRSTAQKKPPRQNVQVSIQSGGPESYEIDLRGKTFDEARVELDLFLDRLHMAGFEQAHIIHGKGTGALRTKISAYLTKHSRVENFRLGAWNEGSYGVTVVTLRK